MAETTPGGVYVVNGQRVDANGRPLPEPEPKQETQADGVQPDPPNQPRPRTVRAR